MRGVAAPPKAWDDARAAGLLHGARTLSSTVCGKSGSGIGTPGVRGRRGRRSLSWSTYRGRAFTWRPARDSDGEWAHARGVARTGVARAPLHHPPRPSADWSRRLARRRRSDARRRARLQPRLHAGRVRRCARRGASVGVSPSPRGGGVGAAAAPRAERRAQALRQLAVHLVRVHSVPAAACRCRSRSRAAVPLGVGLQRAARTARFCCRPRGAATPMALPPAARAAAALATLPDS